MPGMKATQTRDPRRLPAGWSRRHTLGALAAGAASLVGCGGANETSGGAGSAGAGAGGGAGQGGSAGAGSLLGCRQTGPTPGCLVTEDNILGPYYKAGAPFRKDITDGAAGQALLVGGTVYGCDCVTPLAGAEVDVWQADDAGAYDNLGYVLRGKTTTDEQGRYEFLSILPGFYLNGATYRPRHVHYKVSHPDGAALTTQLYFEGDPYIPTDPFVRASLVKPLVEEPAPGGSKLLRVTFDVVLA